MAENKQVPPKILAFLQSLLMEKGLDSLPGNIQGDMLYDLYLRYNDFLIVSFLKGMDQKARDDFNDLLEKKASEKEIEEFLKERTDYQKIAEETTKEFKQIYLGK